MNFKEKLGDLFKEDKEYYKTSDFLIFNHNDIPEKIIIRNDPKLFLFITGLMVTSAVVNNFIYHSEIGFYVSIMLAVFFSLLVLNRSPKIILNSEGIYLKDHGIIKWKDVENTYLRVITGDSHDWYIVIETKGKLTEYSIYGLDKKIDELSHLVEAFKLKYGNKALTFTLNKK